MFKRLELQTLVLGLLIYALWFGLTFYFREFPLYLSVLLAGTIVAWQSSLQHECVHDHPSSSRLFNAVFAGLSLWLYLPFSLYRETHLEHHASEQLTSPNEDCESFYFTGETWQRFGAFRQAFWTMHNTLLGRVVLGPPVVLCRLAATELALLRKGDLTHVPFWLIHSAVVAAILWWTTSVCDLAVWEYLLYFVYPGMSLSLVRSFAEHMPSTSQIKRSAIIEAGPVFSLLFLSNNLHLLHHKRPLLPWYKMKAAYRKERELLLTQNDNLVYAGYSEIAQRFLFRKIACPMHPTVER